MAERNVRFIQLFHPDWDHHSRLGSWCKSRCSDIDQPTAALLRDLKQRGLLEDTLVVWGGEFGRTAGRDRNGQGETAGRDHNARAFCACMAGGGVKGGYVHGATDDLGRSAAVDILRLVGFDHEKLTYRYNGRDFRLTDVAGKIVNQVMA
jgi:uncharacterized protein (DUF1501 family)